MPEEFEFEFEADDEAGAIARSIELLTALYGEEPVIEHG